MIIIQTILAFILALSVLIVIHELGHYWMARLCNVKVLRFSLGMGKVLFSREFGPEKTEWAISALPLGGYVKLLDARSDDLGTVSEEDRKREFTSQNVWRRMAIVVAGPLANFILAIVVLTGLYIYGMPEPVARLREIPENTVAYRAGLRGGETIVAIDDMPIHNWQQVRWKMTEVLMEERPAVSLTYVKHDKNDDDKTGPVTVILPTDHLSIEDVDKDFIGKLGLSVERPPAVIAAVEAGGIAEKAGLKKGDRVIGIDGNPVIDSLALIIAVRNSPGKPMALEVMRNGRSVAVSLTPAARPEKDQLVGKMDAMVSVMPEMTVLSYSVPVALAEGISKTWETSVITVKMIGKMITGDVSLKNITGPIAIADYAGQTARAGLIRYLHFIVFISISIGVMNLLPIPVLDGGLLLYYAVEVVTGGSIPEKVATIGYKIGMGILGILLLIAVFNDVVRLFF